MGPTPVRARKSGSAWDPPGPGPGNYDPIPTRRYVRALTPTGFTLETMHGFSFGPTPQRGDSFVDFHR